MAKYFQTENGYGYTDDDGEIPEGSTAITLAQYNALVAAGQAAQDQAAQEALAAANAQWTLVHDALIAGGVTDPAAEILASAVGVKPLAG